MTCIKGPAVFLAQFLHDEPPFHELKAIYASSGSDDNPFQPFWLCLKDVVGKNVSVAKGISHIANIFDGRKSKCGSS